MPKIPDLNGGVSATTPLNSYDKVIVEQGGVSKPSTVAALSEAAGLALAPQFAAAGIQRGSEDPGPNSIAGLLEVEAQDIPGAHCLQWQSDGSTFYVLKRAGVDALELQIDRYTA